MRINRRSGMTLTEIIVTLGIMALLISLVIPAMQSAREAARRARCLNNVKQAIVAASQYAEMQRSWPLNVTAPWTIALATHLEGDGLRSAWDRDRSLFDSLNNQSVAREHWSTWRCPSSKDTTSDFEWPLAHYSINPLLLPRETSPSDGASQTALFSENSAEIAMPWATGPALSVSSASSNHKAGFVLGKVDGSARMMSLQTQTEVLQAIATPSGGESTENF
jgi:prepilin-type N-terminal cleavage/methylation domain-containing protein